MTLNRYAQRRDANETKLIDLAKSLGCWLIKAPPLDWWLFHRGQWTPLEIKTRKGKYTKAQVDFIKNCARTGAPVLTWRSEEDVLRHVEGPSVSRHHED